MIVYNLNKLYTKVKFCDIMLQNKEICLIKKQARAEKQPKKKFELVQEIKKLKGSLL